MKLQKFAKWLLTDAGKTFSLWCAGTATIGTIFVETIPHTLLIDKYVDIVRLYKSGLSVTTPEYLKKRFEKAVELADIPEDRKLLYQPFLAYGLEIFSLGTGFSKFGCKVGLPKNFTYTDVDSIDKHIIKLNNESIPWELDEGKQLLHSLVLSEKAQLYAIAREVKTGDSMKFLLDSLYPLVFLISAYGISHNINKAYNLYVKPLGLRIFMYCLVGAFSCGNYLLLKDYTQIHYEKKIDEFLKQRDPVLAEGGREYYEKILNRNMALRKLLGKVGESKFTMLGNENYLLRNRHISLVHRKEFFEGDTHYENLV